ncbi:hypothetical protein ACFL43_07185, partial [Thermodesulfobacteriota bacterium]
MSRTLQYIVFYSIFCLVFFGMHAYVYLRLRPLLKSVHPLACWGLVFALAVSFPAASLLEKFHANLLTRVIYTLSSTWLGVLFLLMSMLIVFEPLRIFLKT